MQNKHHTHCITHKFTHCAQSTETNHLFLLVLFTKIICVCFYISFFMLNFLVSLFKRYRAPFSMCPTQWECRVFSPRGNDVVRHFRRTYSNTHTLWKSPPTPTESSAQWKARHSPIGHTKHDQTLWRRWGKRQRWQATPFRFQTGLTQRFKH